ncbi:uncharacterized protein LOC129570647 [Sitodiplosis mosellana]|uniref:uncharacterized protein LOC129570647 n=1 Tax=Sitodiplosis mosellana TaxID=263140 RepID=UPI0024453712|nr:uncharacterized protein LOC129570647 [Sitodiplosis mosellana]
MDLLWKKETRHESALYVDIFRKLNPEMRFIFGEEKRKYYHMTETMINMHVSSEKCDEQSIVYRKQGDALFQQGNWREAMQFYNRCLCLAKVASSHMGIGYAKRAQCFFNLGMYEKCLLDLDLARFSNFPRQQYALLEMREAECLKRMAEGADTVSIVPKLSLKASEKYPEMANGLKMMRDADANWYIVATKDIKVGEIVMVEKSFISTYIESYQKCCICSVTLANLLPCNKCSKVLMCPDCNGSILHKVECDAQVLFCDNYPPVSDTFRSILLAMTMFEDADELMNFIEPIVATDLSKLPPSINDEKSKYRGFLHLAHDSFNLKEDTAMAFVNYSSLMGHDTVSQYFHTEQHQRFLMHLVFHHFSALKSRGLSSTVVGFDDDTEQTDFTFLLATNFGHSCAPHLTLRIVDGYAVMVSVRPITKGQPVLLSQNEMILMNSVDERQQAMQDELGHKCNCERCEFQTSTPNVFIRDPRRAADPDFQFIIRQLNSNTRYDDANCEDFVKCAERFLNKYGHQKWDDVLDTVFLCYYCATKSKYEQSNTFLQKH